MMRTRKNPEIISGRVNSDGSVAAGTGFTIVRTGVGTYNLIFPTLRLISFVANAISAGGIFINIESGVAITGTTLSIVARTSTTGTATDAGFSFVATGISS